MRISRIPGAERRKRRNTRADIILSVFKARRGIDLRMRKRNDRVRMGISFLVFSL